MCTLNERHGYTPVFLTWLYLSKQEERRGPRSAPKTAGGAGVGVEEKKTPRGSESCASTDIHQGSYVVNDLTVYYFPLRQKLFIFLRVEKKNYEAQADLYLVLFHSNARIAIRRENRSSKEPRTMWRNTGGRRGMRSDWWDKLRTVEIIIFLVKRVSHLSPVFEGKCNGAHCWLCLTEKVAL